jgi:hypothetical protein
MWDPLMDESQRSVQNTSAGAQEETLSGVGARILFIDDEAQVARAVRAGLALSGFSVEWYVIIESPYRSLITPLVAYVEAVREINKGATITVILPEYVTKHWWEALLHNQTAFRIKLALYRHPGVVVTNVPYHLEH